MRSASAIPLIRLTPNEILLDSWPFIAESWLEPPARIYGCIDVPPHWFQWHKSTPVTEFTDPRMAKAKFISPILFVDGHVANHNFTRALTEDPYFPYEPIDDWVWYKPAD